MVILRYKANTSISICICR